MKKIFLFGFAAIWGSMLFAQGAVIRDANAQARDVKGFHAIEISSAISAIISAGGEEAVAVSAIDTKYRDLIRTEVRDGVLKIWLENEGWTWTHGDKKLKAYISYKSIDRLTASGASNITAEGTLTAGHLEIRLSGASDFKGSVKTDQFRLEQTGASDATISGSAQKAELVLSGASDIKGYDFTAVECHVEASGASDVKISVSKELYAGASGASSVHYKGEGVIKEIRSSGASSVSSRN